MPATETYNSLVGAIPLIGILRIAYSVQLDVGNQTATTP